MRSNNDICLRKLPPSSYLGVFLFWVFISALTALILKHHILTVIAVVTCYALGFVFIIVLTIKVQKDRYRWLIDSDGVSYFIKILGMPEKKISFISWDEIHDVKEMSLSWALELGLLIKSKKGISIFITQETEHFSEALARIAEYKSSND